MPIIAGIFAGLIVGGIIAWLVSAGRTRAKYDSLVTETQNRAGLAEGKAGALEATTAEIRRQSDQRSEKAAEDFEKLRDVLAAEREARVRAETQSQELAARLDEEKKILAEAREKLTDAFKALAGDSLQKNNQAFLGLARETFDKILAESKGDLGRRQEAIDGLVRPLAESLQQMDDRLRQFDKNHASDNAGIKELMQTVAVGQQTLQKETGNLVNALRTPQVRGRWGEMTLRRVVELAGMSEHCDFSEQVTLAGEEGRLRPDLIVHLPAGRDIVVDAKVSLEAYLGACGADSSNQRETLMAKHAQQVRAHMNGLGAKAYWDSLPKASEFVVMFIPGESFFAEAAHHDASLIEDGIQMKVVPATPTTLIALLRAVAFGWRQEQVARNAQEISDLGKQLYDRIRVIVDHFNDVSGGLEKANTAFNKAVRSLETRILPAARKFKDLGISANDEIPALDLVETVPLKTALPELPSQDEEKQ